MLIYVGPRQKFQISILGVGEMKMALAQKPSLTDTYQRKSDSIIHIVFDIILLSLDLFSVI